MSSDGNESDFESPKKRKHRKTVTTGKRQKLAAPKKPAHYGRTDNNEIESPDNVLDAIRAEFGEFFDPCPFVGKGKKPDFDGTTIEWKDVNYVNPPYNDIEPWCIKAIAEGRKGKTSLLLVPVRTGTRYWQNYIYPFADQLRFFSGRIIFKGYYKASPHHLVLIVFKPNYRINQSPPPLIAHDYGDVFDASKMVKDTGAQNRYPELSIICASMHKAVSGQHSDPDTVAYKNKWLQVTVSFRELVLPTEASNTTLLYTVCLPLFYQMCCYESEQNDTGVVLKTLLSSMDRAELDTTMPIVMLLRKFKPLLVVNRNLFNELFRRYSILPSHNGELDFGLSIAIMNAVWYKDAVGFYKAYVDNARLTRAKLTRSVYTIPSDDGEFEQNVIFL